MKVRNEATIPGIEMKENVTLPGMEVRDEVTISGIEMRENVTIPGMEVRDEVTIPGIEIREDLTILPRIEVRNEATIPGIEVRDEMSLTLHEPLLICWQAAVGSLRDQSICLGIQHFFHSCTGTIRIIIWD